MHMHMHGHGESEVSDSTPSLADRLRSALEHSRNPATGQPYTVPELAGQLGDMVSLGYLYGLRSGQYTAPSALKLKAIGDLLGVTADWLIAGTGAPGEVDAVELAVRRNPAVRRVAAQAASAEISPQLAEHVADLLVLFTREGSPARTPTSAR